MSPYNPVRTLRGAQPGVFRLTIANEMLSLLGSIQYNPLSPAHVPEQNIATISTTSKRRDATPPALDVEMVEEVLDSDDESDPFGTLGRVNDAEAAERKAKLRKEEEAQRKEKKRKRKAEKVAASAGSDGEQPEKKKKKKKNADATS